MVSKVALFVVACFILEVRSTCPCAFGGGGFDIFNPTPIRSEVEVDVVESGCNSRPQVVVPGGCDGGPLVVRPAPNPQLDLSYLRRPKIICRKVEGGELPLKPQASVCSCGTTIVKPALVPRPAAVEAAREGVYGAAIFDSKLEKTLRSLSGGGTFASLLPAGVPSSLLLDSTAGCDTIVDSKPAPPADAVSLSIALQKQLENNLAIVEDRLNFGFNKIPKNVEKPASTPKPNIPEEDLYNVNGEVLELNRGPCGLVSGPKTLKDLEEEALEEILNDELEAAEVAEAASLANAANIALPSLTDLGYREAKFAPNAFVSINREGGTLIEESEFGKKIAGCNGYKPGEVIIQDVPVNPGVIVQPPAAIPCDDVIVKKEVELPPIVTYEQASASRQCQTAEKNNYVYQKFHRCPYSS